MSAHFADIAFTPAVKRLQERNGSRKNYARSAVADAPSDRLEKTRPNSSPGATAFTWPR